jgi:DNA-binding phage protein
MNPVAKERWNHGETARGEIAATDALIRALEGARAGRGISKAELARRISVKPEIVRRLLTDAGGNPTISTVLKVATALDCHLELVLNRGRRAAPVSEAARQARAVTGAPTAARATGTRPRVAARARSRAVNVFSIPVITTRLGPPSPSPSRAPSRSRTRNRR